MKTRSLVLSLSTSLVVISLAACAITAQRIQPQGPPPNVDGWKAVPVVDVLHAVLNRAHQLQQLAELEIEGECHA